MYNLEDGYAIKRIVEDLFGHDAWLDVKHAHSLSQWRPYADRILSAIALSARSTVRVADEGWRTELESIVALGKASLKNADSLEALFADLAGTLTRISFLQFGEVPRHASRARVTLKGARDWKLDGTRSVQYVQTKRQVDHAKSREKRSDYAAP